MFSIGSAAKNIVSNIISGSHKTGTTNKSTATLNARTGSLQGLSTSSNYSFSSGSLNVSGQVTVGNSQISGWNVSNNSSPVIEISQDGKITFYDEDGDEVGILTVGETIEVEGNFGESAKAFSNALAEMYGKEFYVDGKKVECLGKTVREIKINV